MYLSKNNKSGIWYVYYRNTNKKKTRISTKTRTKSEALRFLNGFEQKTKNIKLNDSITLEQFAQRYLKNISISHTSKSYKLSKKVVEQFLEPIGRQTDIRKVDPSFCESYILKTYERAKHHASLQLRSLKAFFNKGIEWGYLEKNPFKKIKLKIPENHPVYIGLEELIRIIGNEPIQTLKRIYQFAFYTGLRISEILQLEWNDIDLINREIQVRNKKDFTTKGKRERMIPISNTISQILKEIQSENHLNNQLIFINKSGERLKSNFVSKKFKKAVRGAKLSECIHFHSLRHSFCSMLVQKEVSLYVVKALAGHQSIVTTQRYSHLRKENLQRAIDQLNTL